MNKKYHKVKQILKDSAQTIINSYEVLPTRNSPRTLLTGYVNDGEEETKKDEYPLLTLDKINNEVSPGSQEE